MPPRDELLDDGGRLRAPWRRMLGTLLGLGTAALRERRAEIDRALADIGAPAVFARQEAVQWRCDPIPLLLSETEFGDLSSRLAQRATVIEHMLADLYGPRRLLDLGVLPPALVYASPFYLHALRGAGVKRHMGLYAADLLRAPDGTWQVLADRTAAAAGLAYVLENRRVMARVLPELFRNLDVAEVRPFFDAWADRLQHLSATEADAPGLALLTPGHADARWFEHVMLARALGMTVVEDDDLTVRDGALWVKSLRGLQRVHVLLRRQDGRHTDPLELHDAAVTHSGTPGLLHAMRNGAVQVLNAPGSDYAEAPALAAFLPQIARALLGEELSLPSVPTYWLGDPPQRAAALADPETIVLRNALDGNAPGRPWQLMSKAGRAAALAEIGAHGERYAATLVPPASAAPCTGEGDVLEPRGVVVRLFLIADAEGWRALPGGLVRVLGEGDIPTGPLPREALSKDVWVLREEGDIVGGSGNLAAPALPIRRIAGDLPSRVADNFYWFGRYLERLDNISRLTRALLARLARGAPLPHEVPEIAMLSACLAEAGVLNQEHLTEKLDFSIAALLAAAITGDAGPFARMILRVQGLADRLRDRLSGEMQQSIRHSMRSLKGARMALHGGRRVEAGLLSDFCGRCLEFCATVAGYAAENMVRGGGRLFLDLGRRVERAQAVANHLRHALDQPPVRIEAGLALALELCDSTITYRSRYLNVVQPAPVLDLVLADDGNPRGLGYQLTQARMLLAVLGGGEDAELAVLMDPLAAETRLIVADLMAASDQAHAAAAMLPRLHAIEMELAVVSDAITSRYFTVLPMRATGQMALA
jgi:uncharacterized circularly permuted ATP-grasp superfamily protein/uncharacterized alpha-E superfamily protein